MSRPGSAAESSHHYLRSQNRECQETWARLIFPITICCFVIIGLRYGFYGDYHMFVGPCSSRLFKVSSLFVDQVEVRDNDRKGVNLYRFSQKPHLSLEAEWSVTDSVTIKSYSRKGFSLWLNKGSRIQIRWEAQTSNLDHLEVSAIKGEGKYKLFPPTNSSCVDTLSGGIAGREAEYVIEEDDSYNIGIINFSPKYIIVLLNLNVSSRAYDISRAKSMCSTKSGSCSLNLPFPDEAYVVVTTPNNVKGDLGNWSIDISFLARVVSYIAVLGALIIFVLLMVKYLGSCNDQTHEAEELVASGRASETEPLVPEKVMRLPYGTDEDQGYDTGSSSEDLYDGMICVICYDMPRNCFFIPCGHCATCHDCAMRIVEVDNRACPICRRFIHRVRNLIIA